MDLVVLNRGQDDEDNTELAPSRRKTSRNTNGREFGHCKDLAATGPIHGKSSMESGFRLRPTCPEVETLPPGQLQAPI
ncbi:hypothetical protein AVEN_113765-1 [Araneus ventricosus]|uniref:Uncharacterized protein n=1 Tax=Araneus ventricosus TaxID=182803 RepID=A0A4Y2VGG7_ARAVE|nr:hypothetical protein AVEN_113765-1 [Araneus ventricosus]